MQAKWPISPEAIPVSVASKSISILLWMGCLSIARFLPVLNLLVLIYTPEWREAL